MRKSSFVGFKLGLTNYKADALTIELRRPPPDTELVYRCFQISVVWNLNLNCDYIIFVIWFLGFRRLLQRCGGGEYSGQLCHNLRTARWTRRLWLPTNNRRKNIARVSSRVICALNDLNLFMQGRFLKQTRLAFRAWERIEYSDTCSHV